MGGTGTIGSAVATLLGQRHDVICAARSGGDVRVDTTSPASVAAMFEQVGRYDALISLCGSGARGALTDATDEAIMEGFSAKALAQMRLVRLGLATMADGGSFTLTSGILSREPYPGFSAIAAVNGAVDAFCLGASVEMPRGIRINAVTPVFMTETMAKAGSTDTPYPQLSAADTAKAYAWSVDGGDFTGRVIDARALGTEGQLEDGTPPLIDQTIISY